MPSNLDHGPRLIQTAELTWRLTVRDFEARYRGSALGAAWALLTPLLTALIFTFVFSTVFQSRWPTEPGEAGLQVARQANFTMVLLVGVLMHAMLAETLNRAAGLIAAHANYVKKVVFPLWVLPVVTIAGALSGGLIGLAVVIAGHLVLDGRIEPTAPLIALVLAPYAMLLLGLAYLLAALGVYLRDLGQLTSFLVTALLFMTPIFYPISAVPPGFQTVMRLNPLTTVVEEARNVLLFGRAPDWGALALLWVASLGVLVAGHWAFRRLRAGFADVL